jgi:predicted membrane protein
MNEKWKDMTTMQKAGFIILCLGAALMVISWVKPTLFPIGMTTPALVIMTVGEAMDYWQKNRKMAWLFIVAAVICLACSLLELFLL